VGMTVMAGLVPAVPIRLACPHPQKRDYRVSPIRGGPAMTVE
jgi:hypothetical protein